jgi:hypothetical protein
MQESNKPKLIDILLSLSEVKEQVTTLRKRIDQISPTPTKSPFEQSPKAFERGILILTPMIFRTYRKGIQGVQLYMKIR